MIGCCQPIGEIVLRGNSVFSRMYEIWSHLARSAEIFEYLVLTLAETVINGKKTGKNRPNCLKTGKILGFRFSCSALFLPSFLESLFLPHPRGGRYCPKYLPLLNAIKTIKIGRVGINGQKVSRWKVGFAMNNR